MPAGGPVWPYNPFLHLSACPNTGRAVFVLFLGFVGGCTYPPRLLHDSPFPLGNGGGSLLYTRQIYEKGGSGSKRPDSGSQIVQGRQQARHVYRPTEGKARLLFYLYHV